MRFATSVATLIASAALSSAATVTFWTLDDVQRTIYFTCNPGSSDLEPVTVSNQQNTTVTFPDTWQGNWYAVKEGAANVPGMLGEVNFGSWHGLTYFDVSAIVDPNDKDNVKQLFPAESHEPMSGCENFPCNNAYYLPDDIQTKATPESALICTLGAGSIDYSFTEAQ
ncbi:dnase1 [Trichoderma arundinaceum]|uniref:Dnase1 n=1 Tax=Trichoderma arundinaceum TaxID=490622 RepID=A0A395NCJ4_TRIAR|nr:dnase1 [Trichoderma arundinaceum]